MECLQKIYLSQETSISCHIKCFYRFSESQAFNIKRAQWHFLTIIFTCLVNTCISGLISEQAKYLWRMHY